MHSTLFTAPPRRLIERFRQERGQALVEFAVVLPVLMLLIVGILTFGRYMDYTQQETQLASEAARSAGVNFNPPGTETIQAYIASQATGELLNGSSDVTSPIQVFLYYPTGSSNVVGNSVRACVTATVRLLPILGAVTSVQLVETATMRIEQLATNWATTDNPAAVPSQCPMS
jgi:Flp pilus assembly protein TadG